MGSVRVEINRAGYRALLNSAAVQADIGRRAKAIADSAAAKLDQDEGYVMDDFEVVEFEGKLARGRVVRTKTDHARASQARNNTLLKSVDAGR